MGDQPKIVTIFISGRAGEHRQAWGPRLAWRAAVNRARQTAPRGRGPQGPPPEAPPYPEFPEELATVEKLNVLSGEICADIERQIRKLAGPEVMVQAEMSFSPGSIVIEGTVILLYWSGSLILEAVKKEVGDLVRVPIKRVLAEVLTELGGNPSRLEIEASVRSRPPEGASVTEMLAPAKAGPVIQAPVWMNAALAVIALGMVFLVADRVIGEWPSRQVVAAAASHPSPP